MRGAARLTAVFLVLSLAAGPCAPCLWAGGSSVSRPAERGKKHVNEEVMAIYKPVVEIGYKAYQAMSKALPNAPDDNQIHTVAWPALAAADGVAAAFKKKIHDDYEALVKEEKENYEADHKAWTNTIFNDLSGALDTLYNGLLNGGALSFSAAGDGVQNNFDRLNPGYRRDGIIYLDDYKDMMSKWQGYSEAFIEANNSQVRDIESLMKSVASMKEASFAKDSGKSEMMRYRKSIQARNQMSLFAAQEVSSLRLDIARQIDARTKFALTVQRTRTDRQAAFERSVGMWRQSVQSAQY